MKNSILIAVLISFGVLTGLALWHHGYWGIIAPHFQSFGAGQVFADLVIALTLVLGSFGPLCYLLAAKGKHA